MVFELEHRSCRLANASVCWRTATDGRWKQTKGRVIVGWMKETDECYKRVTV